MTNGTLVLQRRMLTKLWGAVIEKFKMPGGEKLWEQNLLITVMYSVPAIGTLSIVRTVDNKYIKKHQNVKNAVSY